MKSDGKDVCVREFFNRKKTTGSFEGGRGVGNGEIRLGVGRQKKLSHTENQENRNEKKNYYRSKISEGVTDKKNERDFRRISAWLGIEVHDKTCLYQNQVNTFQ